MFNYYKIKVKEIPRLHIYCTCTFFVLLPSLPGYPTPCLQPPARQSSPEINGPKWAPPSPSTNIASRFPHPFTTIFIFIFPSSPFPRFYFSSPFFASYPIPHLLTFLGRNHTLYIL